jgi:hypothetical protein
VGGDESELTEAAVGADRGQVVHPGELGQLAGRRQLLARGELTAIDRPRDRVDELLCQRPLAVALELRQ